MPLQAFLVERTPYRLRYLVTQTGQIHEIDTLVIPNAGGPSPDLRTDASLFRNFPMHALVSQTIAISKNAALQSLIGNGRTSKADLEFPRTHLYIWARNNASGTVNWAIDVNEGSLAGDPASINHAVLVCMGPTLSGQEAYIDLVYEHSFHR